MKIGILVAGHAPEEMQPDYGDYGQIFSRLLGGHGFTFDIYNVVDNEFPVSAESADGWLVTGSKHGAYEDHDWIPPLEDLLRAAYAKSVPIIGICFGHQVLAQALGGKVVKFDGGWSVGATEYQMADKSVTLNAWHQDQVTVLPKDATVIGHTDFCKNAFLSYGDRALTFQPHPEFEAGFIGDLMKIRGRGLIPDEILNHAKSQLEKPNSNSVIVDQITTFFKQPRGQGV